MTCDRVLGQRQPGLHHPAGALAEAVEVTYQELYRALNENRPVRHVKGTKPAEIVKIVPSGTERWDPGSGALVLLRADGPEPFWERGAVLVPVARPR